MKEFSLPVSLSSADTWYVRQRCELLFCSLLIEQKRAVKDAYAISIVPTRSSTLGVSPGAERTVHVIIQQVFLQRQASRCGVKVPVR